MERRCAVEPQRPAVIIPTTERERLDAAMTAGDAAVAVEAQGRVIPHGGVSLTPGRRLRALGSTRIEFGITPGY